MSMLDSVQPMPVVMRNRCVNCSLLIPRNHPQHSLQQASTTMITILRSWITPTELSSESVLCTECIAILQDRANTFIDGVNPLPLPAFGHRSICFSCGLSILRASRTHAVRSDRPERNIILRKVPLHLVSRLERVCNACWLAAYREVKRQNQQDTNRPILPEVQRPEVSVTSGSGNTSPQRDAAVAQAAETTDDEETRDESPGPEQSETSGNGDTSPQRDATVAHAVETTVEDQIKAFIARVFHYLEQEFETIKNMDAATVLRHLARLPHRTARATGVSEATVLAIIEEEARRNAAERARREGEAHASAAGSGKTRKRRRVRKKQSLAESGSEVSDGSVDEARPSQASVPQDTTIAPAAELLVMKTEPFEYYNEEPAIDIVPANETAINKEQVQKDPISIDVKVEAPVASDDEMTDTNETSPTKPATSKRRRISRQSDRSDHTYTHDQERIDSDPLSSNVKVEAPDEEMNESHMLRVRLKAERENDEEGFS